MPGMVPSPQAPWCSAQTMRFFLHTTLLTIQAGWWLFRVVMNKCEALDHMLSCIYRRRSLPWSVSLIALQKTALQLLGDRCARALFPHLSCWGCNVRMHHGFVAEDGMAWLKRPLSQTKLFSSKKYTAECENWSVFMMKGTIDPLDVEYSVEFSLLRVLDKYIENILQQTSPCCSSL